MRSGQALVLVLLVLAVGLTTGLAVVSRSVTDIATTTTQEESSRSLSAAEAGVEAALSGGNLSANIGSGASFSAIPTEIRGTTVSSPEGLVAGESATFFLVPHDANGNLMIDSSPYTGTLDLCWGKSGLTTVPAIEATVYYKDGTNFKVMRSAFDANATSRNNNFSNAPTNVSGCPTVDQTYSYKARVNMPASPLGGVMLRARLLYGSNDEPSYIAVIGSSDLPIQGKEVKSTGTTGDTTRKIEVENRYPDISPLLDTAVFSGSNLEKN